MRDEGALDGDCSLKDKVGGACESDLLGMSVFQIKSHFEGVTSLDLNRDWRGGLAAKMVDESRGNDSSTAGQRFILHSALVGTDGQGGGGENLGKVGIGPCGCESGMVAQGAPPGNDRGILEIGYKDHGMRDSGIKRVNLEILTLDLKGMCQLEAVGFAHAKTDPVAGQEFGCNGSSHGQEWKCSLGLANQTGGIPGKAPGSVATHFGFASIRIVITHPGHLRGAFDGNQAVSTNAAMAVAKAGNLVASEAAGAVTVVDHDEVVSSPVHLGELKKHVVYYCRGSAASHAAITPRSVMRRSAGHAVDGLRDRPDKVGNFL
jgi:hypothetical protein